MPIGAGMGAAIGAAMAIAQVNVRPLGAAHQPTQTIIKQTDGLFINRTVVAKAGTALPQHAHNLPHLSFLASGAVRVFANDKYIRDVTAPDGITIEANVKHMFVTLADNTIIDCIHVLGPDGEPVITERNDAFLPPTTA